MTEKYQQRSLSEDLQPLMRLLRLSGHFMPDYERGATLLKMAYSLFHIVLGLMHFIAMLIQLLMQIGGDQPMLISNTLTLLFFLHGITKLLYFMGKRKQFYSTLRTWEKSHSHPLFVASDNKHRAIFVAQAKQLLQLVLVTTGLTVFFWAIHPFVVLAITSDPPATTTQVTPESSPTTALLDEVGNFALANSTAEPEEKEVSLASTAAPATSLKMAKLLINARYPWNPYGSSFAFAVTYFCQLYWLVFCICQINLLDTLFCSWLIYGCQQLRHLKDGMHSMMLLSSQNGPTLASISRFTLENYDEVNKVPPAAPKLAFQRLRSSVAPTEIITPVPFGQTIESLILRLPLAQVDMGPSNDADRQSLVIRSAIKYWVQRHKHILKYVESIGESYGSALLLHMLTSTVTLTLLSYEATKITGLNLHAMIVIGHLSYTLSQVFLFCLYGNRLIEESVSVMHATYSCPWYDGSEEAKTFVQIVCQQCQRPLSVSGAKFFTVSLDLFASVLGAVVTYFMVLIQLN